MNGQLTKQKNKPIDKDVAIIFLIIIAIIVIDIAIFVFWSHLVGFIVLGWFCLIIIAIAITHIGAEADKKQEKITAEFLENKKAGNKNKNKSEVSNDE